MYSVIEKDEDHILLEFYGGTLYVSDKGLFAGTELNDLVYWNGSAFAANPEKTAECFVQNPLNKAYPEIIYRTGDIGRRNERGELVFVSRKKAERVS